LIAKRVNEDISLNCLTGEDVLFFWGTANLWIRQNNLFVSFVHPLNIIAEMFSFFVNPASGRTELDKG